MPLFVPILIGAAVVAATGYGGKKGYDGVSAMRRAKEIGETAEQRHRRHVALLESARDHLAKKLEQTHTLRLEIARTTLGRMVELLQTLERRGRVRTPEDFTRIGVKPEQVRAFVAQYIEAGGTIQGAISAAGAGTGASVVTTGLVASLATASTGTAISGLSGAAAQSAILAWLGGGSLAAGGGGMALGSIMLGGITVAPAIAIGGFVLAVQGEKAVTKAMDYQADVDKAIARMDRLIAFHHRAEKRADELQEVLRRIDARASAVLDELFETIDRFDDRNDADIERLSAAMVLCKALSDLLHVKVLNDEGELDPAFENWIARYRPIVEDA